MPHLRYISENPYAQYFLGLEEFTEEPLFDASMMVHCRKRFSAEVIEEINQAIFLAEAKAAVEEEPEDSGSTSKSPDAKEDLNLCRRLKVLYAFCLDWFCTVVLRGRTKSQAFSRPYLTKKSVV